MCLERYDILIGEDAWGWDEDLDHGKTKSMKVDLGTSIDLLEKTINMLMESEVVFLSGIDRVTNLSDGEGFPKCKKLFIKESSTLQQIVGCGTTVCFPVLESLELDFLGCLMTICQGRLVSSKSFGELKTLTISDCHKLKSLFSVSGVRSLPQLEKIKIEDCNEMEALFVVDEESTQVLEFPCLRHLDLSSLPQLKCFLDVRTSKSSKTASTTTKLTSLFNETVALPSLEVLELSLIDNIEIIWSSGASGASSKLNSLRILNCDKLQRVFPDSTQHSFHKLESLHISHCDSLTLLFPLVIAKTFSELKNLNVVNCDELEEIVEAGEESTSSLPFRFFLQLTSLTLWQLKELRSLYPFGPTSKWPNLGEVKIYGCPKTEGISLSGEQGSPAEVGQSHITNHGKKIVLKLNLHDYKAKKKAMTKVCRLPGVDSISVDMKDNKLTVTGNMDPVHVVSTLRKKIGHTDLVSIVSVGPAKEEKKDGGKKDDSKKKDDGKKDDHQNHQHFGPEFGYRQP